jgi:transposase
MGKVASSFYGNTYKALQTVQGIGLKSAAILIAVTGNFKNFNHYKQLVAYVGLNPRIFES